MNVHAPPLTCIFCWNAARLCAISIFHFLYSPHPLILFPIFSPCLDPRFEYAWIIDYHLIYQHAQSLWRFGGNADRKVERNREGKGGWEVVRPLTLGQLWARPQRPETSMFSFSTLSLFSPHLLPSYGWAVIKETLMYTMRCWRACRK